MIEFHPLVLLPLLSFLFGLCILGLTVHSLSQRGYNAVLVTFALNVVSGLLTAGVQAVRLSTSDLELQAQLFALKDIGMWFGAITILLFALAYTDNEEWITREYLVGIGLVTVAYLSYLVVVGPDIIVTGATTISSLELVLIERTYPPFLIAVVLISYAHALVAIFLFASLLISNKPVYRIQGALLLTALAIALTGVGVHDIFGTAINPYPLTYSVSMALVAIAIYRYKFLEHVPVARRRVIEEMNDGYLVLDDRDTIVDHNPAAAALFPESDELVGMRIEAVIHGAGDGLNPGDGDSITVEVPEENRFLSVATSEMASGGRTGRLLIITDVTELKERERELELLNRVVRHDIQNNMNVVLGYAQLANERCDAKDVIDPIISGSRETVELCEAVRDVLEAFDRDDGGDLEAVPLVDVLREELDRARATYTEADFQLAVNVDEDLTIQANDMINSIFRNLYSNAIRHNDQECPAVSVSVTQPSTAVESSGSSATNPPSEPDGTVRVRIADNGPGIPDDRKESIFGRGEMGLDSPGTGVGLYLVDTLVALYGGTVSVQDNDPRGTIFTIEFPAVCA